MSSSSNLVNQSTTNSRWSLFPSIMSFHLHRTLPHTVFFSSTEDEEKKCGDGGETERKPFEDPLLQRAKIQEEKEKKMETKIQNKKKGKRSEPHPLPPPKAKEVKRPGPQQQQKQQEQWRVLVGGGAKKDQKCRFAKCNAQQLPFVERRCFFTLFGNWRIALRC